MQVMVYLVRMASIPYLSFRLMKILKYIIRFLLALIFVYAGIEKLFLPIALRYYKSDVEMTDSMFFEFYGLLQRTGYLYFVGFFQLVCGLLQTNKNDLYWMVTW